MPSSPLIRTLTLALLVLVQTTVAGLGAPCGLVADHSTVVVASEHAHDAEAPAGGHGHHAGNPSGGGTDDGVPASHDAGCEMATTCAPAAQLTTTGRLLTPLLRAAPIIGVQGDYASVRPSVEPPPPR